MRQKTIKPLFFRLIPIQILSGLINLPSQITAFFRCQTIRAATVNLRFTRSLTRFPLFFALGLFCRLARSPKFGVMFMRARTRPRPSRTRQAQPCGQRQPPQFINRPLAIHDYFLSQCTSFPPNLPIRIRQIITRYTRFNSSFVQLECMMLYPIREDHAGKVCNIM